MVDSTSDKTPAFDEEELQALRAADTARVVKPSEAEDGDTKREAAAEEAPSPPPDPKYSEKASERGQLISNPESVRKTTMVAIFTLPDDLDKFNSILEQSGRQDPPLLVAGIEKNFHNGKYYVCATITKLEYQIL